MVKIHFRGGAGIKNPVDFNGEQIKEGDVLTHCWFENDYVAFFAEHLKVTDLEEIEKRVHEPNVIVKFNQEKGFFYGVGYKNESDSYIHDFRFKFTKIVKPQSL